MPSSNISLVVDVDERLKETGEYSAIHVLQVSNVDGTEKDLSLLRKSKFSFLPPTLHFRSRPFKGELVIDKKIQKKLLWCSNNLLPKIVKQLLKDNGFSIVPASQKWLGYWGRHQTTRDFKYILPYQKVNHFPGNFFIARKDRLWSSIDRMAKRWSKEDFGFVPDTYILPRDKRALISKMNRGKKESNVLILKPPSSARGCGIRLTSRVPRVIGRERLIAQSYISRPFLVDGFKVDLRLYVLVTSWLPLRAYIYEEGIVRFASCRYTTDLGSLRNPYVHLTNYSINKLASGSEKVDLNEDQLKWSLGQFWEHLANRGVDCTALMNRIHDMIIKTLISCESAINSVLCAELRAPFVSYELYGFDVLLDADLRPWLIEVNISPSVRCVHKVDFLVKLPLVEDVLNISGIQVPSSELLRGAYVGPPKSVKYMNLCVKPCHVDVTNEVEEKIAYFEKLYKSTQTVDMSILDNLSSFDVRYLLDMEDEHDRKGRLIPLIPTPSSGPYLKYFRRARYLNLLLAAWTERHNHSKTGCDILEKSGRQLLAHCLPADIPSIGIP